MTLFKSITTFLFTVIVTTSFCQTPDYSSIIFGTWVTTESLLRNEIETPGNSRYAKYQFFGNGKVFFGTNEYERGKEHQYAIQGDKLPATLKAMMGSL